MWIFDSVYERMLNLQVPSYFLRKSWLVSLENEPRMELLPQWEIFQVDFI